MSEVTPQLRKWRMKLFEITVHWAFLAKWRGIPPQMQCYEGYVWSCHSGMRLRYIKCTEANSQTFQCGRFCRLLNVNRVLAKEVFIRAQNRQLWPLSHHCYPFSPNLSNPLISPTLSSFLHLSPLCLSHPTSSLTPPFPLPSHSPQCLSMSTVSTLSTL